MEQKPQKEPASQAPFDRIEGTLERFTYRDLDSGFAVVRFCADGAIGRITAVGQLAQLAEGQRLRLSGQQAEHPRFGAQLQVEAVEAILPTTVEGIRTYLASSLIKGIGPATAERITERFGADTLRIIEEEPERLREVPGLGAKRIAELQEAVQSQRDVQEVMVFLRSHGLGQGLATRIVKRYGRGAAALIQANPFRLADEVIGIGFKTADQLAQRLGLAREAPERIQAGLQFCLSRAAMDGHCFLPQEQLLLRGSELLGLAGETCAAEIPALQDQGRIKSEEDEVGTPRLYPTTLHQAERGVAEALQGLLDAGPRGFGLEIEAALQHFAASEAMTLPAGQRDAVATALRAPVSVITGGPGVGKTTIIRALCDILQRQNRQILLCAPTGRAAKRLEESTGHGASTIHRLLEWQAGVNRFLRDAGAPLEGDLLVVDEASMLDLPLCYNLLRAIPKGMHLVLVGDIDQLPSVGPGQVLGDLIASERVPVTRLTQIFRQQGQSHIVANAHALLQGERPVSGPADGDFFFIEARDNEHARGLIRELVQNRIRKAFGIDPLRELQVLCPMYRGTVGADGLNRDLQDLLNPGGRELSRGAKRFRIGDKVMQVRNDYDLDLFNGDAGWIEGQAADDSQLRVRFGERIIDYPLSDLDSLIPAYAITVHRAQGSEYPAVLIPLASDHFMMLRRNLLYTAITRGKRLVVLVGTEKALDMAVHNDEEARRHTGLATRLREGRPGA